MMTSAKELFRRFAGVAFFYSCLCLRGTGIGLAAQGALSPVQTAWQAAVAKGFSGGAMVVAGTNTLLFEVHNSAKSKQFILKKDTLLPVCSVTKAMTAEIVFELIEEGRLALDGTLKDYLPWMPRFAQGITLRQLLTHTSGLRNMDLALGDDTNGTSRIYLTFDESWRPLPARILGIIGQQAAAPAGTKYDYNNADFLVLQAAVEQVSGQTFEQLLQARIFRPAGMRRSMLARWRSTKPTLVDCYTMQGSKESGLERFNLAIYGGAAGVISTPEDLLKWLQFLPRQPSGRALLLSGSQFGGFQGFGGYASRTSFIHKQQSLPGDELIFERPGAVNGYTLQVSFLPERGVAAAAFSNRAGEKLGSVYEGSGLIADLIAAACELPAKGAPR